MIADTTFLIDFLSEQAAGTFGSARTFLVRHRRELIRALARIGQRLGENDNWIAGFCRYYREPVISRDIAFERVPRLRRIAY